VAGRYNRATPDSVIRAGCTSARKESRDETAQRGCCSGVIVHRAPRVSQLGAEPSGGGRAGRGRDECGNSVSSIRAANVSRRIVRLRASGRVLVFIILKQENARREMSRDPRARRDVARSLRQGAIVDLRFKCTACIRCFSRGSSLEQRERERERERERYACSVYLRCRSCLNSSSSAYPVDCTLRSVKSDQRRYYALEYINNYGNDKLILKIQADLLFGYLAVVGFFGLA